MKQRRYDEAISDYKKAIRLSPRNLRYHLSLSLSCMESGNYDEALIDLNGAIESDPQLPFYTGYAVWSMLTREILIVHCKI